MGKISYTNRDIVAIRKEIMNRIQELTNDWRDMNESDVGVTYIEFLAGIADMLNFYLDSEALEHSIYSARQDKNIRSILRSMNYRIPLMCAAKWSLNITFNENLTKSIKIPKYTAITSNKRKKFCVLNDITLIEGRKSFNIPLIQGMPSKIVKTVGDLKRNRRLYINSANVADGSVYIYQDGNIWECVDDALLCYEGGYYFSVHKDSSNNIYILFSPDWRERLGKDDSSEVEIFYVDTEGTAGVVAEDSISRIEFGSGVDKVSIINGTNAEIKTMGKPYGAVDDIDLNKVKSIAQYNMKVMDRYVTLEDYENRVRQEPYISDCVVFDWKSTYVDRPFNVDIYAITVDGQDLYNAFGIYVDDDSALKVKKALLEDLNNKGVSYNTVNIRRINMVETDLKVKVVIKGVKTVRDDIKYQIQNKLKDFYSVQNWKFGKRFSISQTMSEIYEVSSSISSVEIINPNKDLEVLKNQFLKVNSIDVLVVGDDIDE